MDGRLRRGGRRARLGLGSRYAFAPLPDVARRRAGARPRPRALAVAQPAHAQRQQVTALCSTDQSWCELAAKEFEAQTGIKVLQATKAPARRSRSCAPRPPIRRPTSGGAAPATPSCRRPRTACSSLPSGLPQRPVRLVGAPVRACRAQPGRRLLHQRDRLRLQQDVLKKKKLPEPRCWADLVKPEYKGEIETRTRPPAAPATPSSPAWCS